MLPQASDRKFNCWIFLLTLSISTYMSQCEVLRNLPGRDSETCLEDHELLAFDHVDQNLSISASNPFSASGCPATKKTIEENANAVVADPARNSSASSSICISTTSISGDIGLASNRTRTKASGNVRTNYVNLTESTKIKQKTSGLLPHRIQRQFMDEFQFPKRSAAFSNGY